MFQKKSGLFVSHFIVYKKVSFVKRVASKKRYKSSATEPSTEITSHHGHLSSTGAVYGMF